MLKPSVSVIICAYNEERFIEQTLKDLLKCAAVDEIIVVNDGSKDKTLDIIKKYQKQIKIISYRKNRGKGYAFYCGVRASTGNIIVTMDAHLKNIKNSHIKKLTGPIIRRQANWVIAPRVNWNNNSVPTANLTGERAYLKEILIPYLPRFKDSRFGLETYLNEFFNPKWGKTVLLKGVVHPLKNQKMPPDQALSAYIKEIIEISKTKAEIAAQNHRQLLNILKKTNNIKSVKNLRSKIGQIKDQEILELIKKYL